MGKVDTNLIDPVLEPTAEKIHRIVRAALSTVPVAGGVLVELMNTLIHSPMEKRFNLWAIQVSDAINDIIHEAPEKTKLIEEIIQNERFNDALILATTIAIKTHKKEKHIFLKNGLINAALQTLKEEDKEDIFFRMIDEFSEWHISLLLFYANPHRFLTPEEININNDVRETRMYGYIIKAFPSLANDINLIELIWGDLKGKRLIMSESPTEVLATPQDKKKGLVIGGMTTSIADEFITFISNNHHQMETCKKGTVSVVR